MKSGRFPKADALLQEIAEHLISGRTLPEQFRDQSLTGNWKGHRDCHLYPDLVVIRRIETETQIVFVRMGTHSEVFN